MARNNSGTIYLPAGCRVERLVFSPIFSGRIHWAPISPLSPRRYAGCIHSTSQLFCGRPLFLAACSSSNTLSFSFSRSFSRKLPTISSRQSVPVMTLLKSCSSLLLSASVLILSVGQARGAAAGPVPGAPRARVAQGRLPEHGQHVLPQRLPSGDLQQYIHVPSFLPSRDLSSMCFL